MSRCKLISPVLLQLEQPMLSPVEESEFVIYGVKEYGRARIEVFCLGFLSGLCFAIGLVAMVVAVHR